MHVQNYELYHIANDIRNRSSQLIIRQVAVECIEPIEHSITKERVRPISQ